MLKIPDKEKELMFQIKNKLVNLLQAFVDHFVDVNEMAQDIM